MADLASRDYLKPAPQSVEDNVDKFWSADWKAYGTVGDTFYGAPLMASVKGFIWYSPAKFAEWGVEVPQTWDDLLAVTKTIQEKTGTAPWCAGFGSGEASGWPGTDWVEDLVLRQAGADVYDKWVTNEIPFTDPAIASALDAVGDILLNPAYVNATLGDVTSINSAAFGDVATPVANGTCAMTHQASFFDGYITDAGGEVGPDGDVWAFLTRPTRKARSFRKPSPSCRMKRPRSASTVPTSCPARSVPARSGRAWSTGSMAPPRQRCSRASNPVGRRARSDLFPVTTPR